MSAERRRALFILSFYLIGSALTLSVFRFFYFFSFLNLLNICPFRTSRVKRQQEACGGCACVRVCVCTTTLKIVTKKAMWQNPRSINNNYFPPPQYQSAPAPAQQSHQQHQGNGWQNNSSNNQYAAAGGHQSAQHFSGQPPRQQRRLEGTPQNPSNSNFSQSGPALPRMAAAPLHVGHHHPPHRQEPQVSAPHYVQRVPHIHPVHSPAPPTTNGHEDLSVQTKNVSTAISLPKEAPTEAQYLQFLQAKKSEMMCRGTFFLANHKRRGAALPSNGPKTVNIDQWNQYWEAFSDEVSDYETTVRQILEHQEVPRSNAPPGASRDGDTVARQNRRRVIVKISGGNGQDIYADVVRLALRFGVLESVKVKHDEYRVQFTTSSAAFAYASCVKCTPRSITLPSMYKHDVSGQCLHAFFVEQRAALESNPPPSVLVLSNLADMPTVFLTALFRDCYDATDVRYVQPQRRDAHAAQPSSPSGGSSSSAFHIHFQNYQAAKYALHVLQQSFFEVFELSLTFLGVSEQLDLGVAL